MTAKAFDYQTRHGVNIGCIPTHGQYRPPGAQLDYTYASNEVHPHFWARPGGQIQSMTRFSKRPHINERNLDSNEHASDAGASSSTRHPQYPSSRQRPSRSSRLGRLSRDRPTAPTRFTSYRWRPNSDTESRELNPPPPALHRSRLPVDHLLTTSESNSLTRQRPPRT